MKSWKSTVTGTILLIAGIVLFYLGHKVEGGLCVVAGIQGLVAKDSTATGVGKYAQTKSEVKKEGLKALNAPAAAEMPVSGLMMND